MKLPRDVDATVLIKALARLGYQPVRQTGSHVRLCCNEPAHALTIPNHRPLKIGTLAAILVDVATCRGMSKDELLDALFG